MGRSAYTVLSICIVAISYMLYVSVKADLATTETTIMSPTLVDHPATPPEKKWAVTDDRQASGSEVLWTYDSHLGQYRDLTISGTDGKPLAVIHRDTGKVTLYGHPNEAARIFWDSVGKEAIAENCDENH